MNRKLIDILRDEAPIKQVAGDLGIEVEMEGKKLPMVNGNGWNTTRDGSLRGEESFEYVFSSPAAYQVAESRLRYLWRQFTNNEAVLDPGNTASVHVHLNMQHVDEDTLFKTMVIYLILENALVKWCGETREGNLFCLRARDAEYLIDQLEMSARTGVLLNLGTDKLRYAAMNVKALWNYGSLEFRAMRGLKEYEPILQWAKMLVAIREAAGLYRNCSDIVENFSGEGHEAFVRSIFNEDVFNEVFSYEGWEDDITEGMRRCQCIAYAYDARKEARENPKKAVERNKRAVAQKAREARLREGRLHPFEGQLLRRNVAPAFQVDWNDGEQLAEVNPDEEL